jgi:hypothetical protein
MSKVRTVSAELAEDGSITVSADPDVTSLDIFMGGCAVMASAFNEDVLRDDDWIEPTIQTIRDLVQLSLKEGEGSDAN